MGEFKDIIPEEYDVTSQVGDVQLKNYLENKKVITHNFKVGLGLAIVFIIGGLQALHGLGGLSAYIDMLVPILLAVEHVLNGNTQ